MGMDVDIRELASSELGELLRLYEHLHVSDDPLPPVSDVEAIWQSIHSNPAFKYFGVFVEEGLVASCTVSIIPNLTRRCRPYAVVENVVTHEGFRRRGLGTALLKHALSFAWQAGCYKAMLMTGRKDEGTFEFYEAAGFNSREKQAFIAKPRSAEQTAARDRAKHGA